LTGLEDGTEVDWAGIANLNKLLPEPNFDGQKIRGKNGGEEIMDIRYDWARERDVMLLSVSKQHRNTYCPMLVSSHHRLLCDVIPKGL
jgi:hypothetical protein